MADIPGATSSTYVLTSAEQGKNITVKVTATNVAGSANATSVAVGPVAFSPASLPGLTGWFDTNVASSLTLSGSTILTIANQVAGGVAMGQYSSRNRPTYSITGLSGLPGIVFSAASSQMLAASPFPMGTGNTATIWWVGYWTALSSDSARPMSYVGAAQTHDYNNAGSWVLERGGTSTNHRLQRNSTGTPYQTLSYSTPTRFIATVKSDGTMTFYKNGVAGSTASSGGNWISNGVLGLGSGSLDAAYIDGAIGEFGVSTSYSDAATVAQLDAYLVSRWNYAAPFLARTTGLDATHIAAYTALINGLVADGIWFRFDALWITATQNSATALLNLISPSFPLVPNGSPTFTADRGFTGTGTSYLDTGINLRTGTTKFLQNDAHISAWSVTATTSSTYIMGASDGSISTAISPRNGSGNFIAYLNSGGFDQAGSATGAGHFLTRRIDNSFLEQFINGVSVNGDIKGSGTPPSQNLYVGGLNSSGTPQGAPNQLAMASIGSDIPNTFAAAFYARLRTYMTAVGVP